LKPAGVVSAGRAQPMSPRAAQDFDYSETIGQGWEDFEE
jgi:hypothetical protein